ncbi:hypothetical protein D3C86_1889840 [compost metagenome]
MRGVKEQFEFVAPRNVKQGFRITGTSPEVHTNDARGSGSNHAFNGLRVEVMGLEVDISEYRCNLLPLERMGGCDEGHGGDDDLIFHPQGPNRQL